MRVHYQNVNPQKLSAELHNAGIEMLLIENDTVENTWITFKEGTNMTVVESVIKVHDITPLPQIPTAEERIEELERMIDILLKNN